MNAAPSAIDTVCGVLMIVSAAENTRPCNRSGVRVWIAVPNPTISHATPAPATAIPKRISGRLVETNVRSPSPNSAMPKPTSFASPSRRKTRAAVTPPAIAPTPCSDESTPKNEVGRCRPWSSTAKITVSEKPTTSKHMPREDDLHQRVRAEDVARAREHLGHEVVFFALEARLRSAHEEQRRHDGDEARGVEHRDGAAAEQGIEAGPRERCDDPQALARCRERSVRLREQLLREHDLEQRRAGGVEDGAEGPVGERDRVDQPGVAAVVDEQEHEHERAEHAVGDDHQRPPAHPVGEQPTEWREQ